MPFWIIRISIVKTSFILIYDTCSCVGNYSCTKEKALTFSLTFVYNIANPYAASIMQENILGLVYSALSTIFTRPCTKWFPSFSFSIKCCQWRKKNLLYEIYLVNPFVDNFLSSNPANFHLRGINIIPDKWQEVNQNIKCIIDWNLFIVFYS